MRRPLIAAAALLVLAVGGCGIPENSGVTVVGPGRSSGTSIDEGGSPPLQGTRESTNVPAEFVDYYLEAAAGDPETALNRVKAFMSEEFASSFKGGPEVKVIRLTEKPLYTPGNPEITLRAQPVGTLKSNGALEPADPGGSPAEYRLRVTEVAGKGLFITQAPPWLLLTDTGLNNFYQRRTIYFWNPEQTGLVPDMRYMPRSVPIVQQPTTILSWLANGPAPWLTDRVRSLPPGTVAPENVPAISDETLQVKLNANAVPPGDVKAQDMLRRQLQWSLRPLLPRVMELKIGHQDSVKYSSTDYLSSNPAYRLTDTPERFVIFNGVVRRLVDSPRAADPMPVLRAADNKGIAAAAMSGSATHTFVAVVAAGANGRGQRLRVASAPSGAQAGLKDVAGLSGTLGRPVWAVTVDGDPAGAVGLITVNGRLYSFGADGSRARPVEWQDGAGAVAAIAVAPDGHRLVLVSGGRLYRSVLEVSGDAITLSTPEALQAPTLSTVSAVAWSSEDWLVVAGVRADGRVSIMDLSVDGALQAPRLSDIGDKTVSYLTAYPANPAIRDKSALVSYTAAGSAWDALSTPYPITASDLAGLTGNPPAGGKPTAPFFLG